jgi:hypothetical protein
MTLDASGNLGLGVVPTTDHNPVVEALQIGSTANLFGRNDAETTTLTSNSYLSLAGYPKYITTNEASEYTQVSGNHIWYNAPSGTAGAACTQTERMRINATGQVGIGTSSPNVSYVLEVSGAVPAVMTSTSTVTSPMYGGLGVKRKTNANGNGTGIGFVLEDAGSIETEYGYIGGIIESNTAGSEDGGLLFATTLNNTRTERMRIDSNGNVGISTSSPVMPLDVIANAGANALSLRTRVGDDYSFLTFRSNDGTEDLGGLTINRTAASTSNLLFYTNSGGSATERMRIDSVGSVGIGVTPSTWSSTVYDALQIGGSIGVGAIVGRRDGINQVHFGLNWNYDGGATNTYVGSSFATNYSQEAGTHRWFHAASGTAGDAFTFSESMRIDASGNLLVGCTSSMGGGGADGINGFGVEGSGGGKFVAIQNTTDANMYIAKNSGYSNSNFISFYVAGTKVGGIVTNGTTTAYNTSSDQRLKENIEDADDAGSKIDAIQVRKFDWKVDGSHQDYGMVAQELQAVAPEAVSAPEDSDEMMGVDYSKLVPMMLKEIQSLRARVSELES